MNECGGYYCSEDIGHIDCDKAIIERYRGELDHIRRLLTTVYDAGRPHSHLCDCDQCNAFDAVRKELRGE